MIKIRGLVIPDEDKKYVSELSKANPFIYENIDFRDRIPLSCIKNLDCTPVDISDNILAINL